MSASTSWRRGFAAGFAALAVSVAGHFATGAVSDGETCSYSRGLLAERLADRVMPDIQARGIVQRVARAVLGVVFNTCS